MTFEQIKAKGAKLGVKSALGREIDYLIDCGRVNADDTIHKEKAAPESEWDTIAAGSIGDLLGTDLASKRAVAWFRRIGYRW